jgi:hypothetical protein
MKSETLIDALNETEKIQVRQHHPLQRKSYCYFFVSINVIKFKIAFFCMIKLLELSLAPILIRTLDQLSLQTDYFAKIV